MGKVCTGHIFIDAKKAYIRISEYKIHRMYNIGKLSMTYEDKKCKRLDLDENKTLSAA